MPLDIEQLARVVNAAVATALKRGHGHFAWRDPPGPEETREAADGVWTEKLNGAYTERTLAYLGLLMAVVGQDHPVRLVQFSEEDVPFDASGWTAVVVGGTLEGAPGWWTVLHISPDDLDASELVDIVEIVNKNDAASGFVAYDDLRPTKPAEYAALLEATWNPDTDIIARIASLSRVVE